MKAWQRTWSVGLRPPKTTIARRSLVTERSSVSESSYPKNDHYEHCKSRKITDLLQAHEKSLLNDRDYVEVDGYVQTFRKQKKMSFAVIQDGKSLDTLQALIPPNLAEGLSTGTAVRLKGGWRLSPPGKEQPVEVHVETVQILGENDSATNPLQKKYQTSQFLRTIPHLRARLPQNALLLRLRSELIAAMTTHFAEQDFVQSHTPVITSSDCEGAGEVFTVSSNSDQKPAEGKAQTIEHFFRDPKYLTVSAQLHLEALAQSVGKVWTLSPTFRAERSDTPRHLSEFYMLEAEVAFESDMDRVMDIVEDMLRSVATTLREAKTVMELFQLARKRAPEPDSENDHEAAVTPEILQQRWEGLRKANWPRITYGQATEELQSAVQDSRAQFEHPVSYEAGLQAEHERYLAKTFGQGSPVFVTHYPRHQKPFYMTPSTTNGRKTVECFDLLVPDLCELAGGSMREHRSKELVEAMRNHGLLKNSGEQPGADDISNLQWYIDLRKYGSVPHGGFGLGFDRLISYLSGVPNIRDVVAFPRWYGRCDA